MKVQTDPSSGTELRLKMAEGLLASGAALALFDPDDALYFASPEFCDLYQVPPGPQTFSSLIRHCYQANVGPLIATDDIESWLTSANAKRRSTGNRRFEIDLLDGRWLWASETTFDDGWIFLTVTDFTALKHKEFVLTDARDAAVAAAETDYLTGLLNRGAIMKRFSNLLERSALTQGDFSIALLDLDHFKAVNDTFGHDTGDLVLQHFAQCASKVLRDKDHLGRVGGEEFLLLLSDVTDDQALSVLGRLRYYLQSQPLKIDRRTLNYTFSAGVAQWQAGQALEALYHLADKALYSAKAYGRNCIKAAE